MLNKTNNNIVGFMNKVSCRIFKKKKHVFNAVFASVMGITMAASVANASPTGGQVITGDATIGSSGNTTNINQSSQNAIINWQGFSIGVNEVVNFFNGSGATLNRVVGQSVSEIFGALNASGSVYVINENGVTVGPDGQVAVGGSFVASTRNVSNADFMNGGDITFSGSSNAAVVNLGDIEAVGDVYMIGGEAFNNGMIKAGGNVGMVAADDVVLMVNDAAGVSYQVVSTQQNTNSKAVSTNPMALAMNGGGQNGSTIVNGRIVRNSGEIISGGDVIVSGASETHLTSTSNINSQNDVYIGGGFQGETNLGYANIPASMRTNVDKGSNVYSNGGQVVNWAQDTMNFSGSINTIGDNGDGNVEVSGHETLHMNSWDVKTGELLLDPSNIEIVAGTNTPITSGVATANTLRAGDIENYLNNSGDLSVQTTDNGQATGGDIDVNADIAWSGNSSLTLRAHRDVNINGVEIDASAANSADFLAFAGNDVNVRDGAVIRSGQRGTVDLNAATSNPFGIDRDDGRVGNWKNGTGTINFEGNNEIHARNIKLRSGKDVNGDRTNFSGDDVVIRNHSGKFGNIELFGFQDVDFNVNGTNDDLNSSLAVLVNAKNIDIDENQTATGAYMLNAAAFDNNTNNFVEYDGIYNPNSLESFGYNSSGWKSNEGTLTFADGTNLDLCCGVSLSSGVDANGNRVDLDNINFSYNRDYAIYNWFQVHGFDTFDTEFEGGVLSSNTFVDIQNGENIIDYNIESGRSINSGRFVKAGEGGDILIVADRDTTIAPNVNIDARGSSDREDTAANPYSGDVVIVVDEQTPFSPSDGKVVMDSTATINSAGNVAFFTSTQDQNSIDGLINGETFNPGTEYVDSSIEEWLVFYQNFDRNGEQPYKVYYKDSDTPDLPAGLDCDEQSGDPACSNFVSLLENRREHRIALSGDSETVDVGEPILAGANSRAVRTNEFMTVLEPNYVDTTLTTNEKTGLIYSIPLNLVQTSLLDLTIPGIQGIAELLVSPITSQF